MTTESGSQQDLAKYLNHLQAEIAEARKQADHAVQHYQTMRKAFYRWLKQANADYMAKRTEKVNEIETLRQEMAHIRMEHTLDLQRYRRAWAKTFAY